MVEILGPILPLTDESQIGKMRDVYPISIFRFEIILTLITAGKFTDAVMLLPITLLLNSVRIGLFNRKRRKNVLHKCFYLIKLMMKQKPHRQGKMRILPEAGERADFVVPIQEKQEFTC
jgi:hypothetical protein